MQNLPFERHVLTLRFETRARLPFQHGAVVMGVLARACGEHLPLGALALALESGRVDFERGDRYRIGFTLVGEARQLAPSLVSALQAIGSDRSLRGTMPLAGNFAVETAELLAAPDLAAEADRIQKSRRISLQFLTPLWMDRPPGNRTPGRTRLDRDCFPPDWFVARLRHRLDCLQAHVDQVAGEVPKFAFESSSVPRLVNSPELLFLDVPSPGQHGKHDDRPTGMTVGGVVGRVLFDGVEPDLVADLVLGQYLHVGEKVHYGFGRFRIAEAGPEDPRLAPAETALSRLADPLRLGRALDRLREKSSAAGVDGVTPSRFAEERAANLEMLKVEVEAGSYVPQPLSGFAVAKSKGGVRGLTIPTVRDRLLQRSACELLGPAIETLLEASSYAYRKGFSRAGAARAIERAYAEGFRFVLDADVSAFFDSVPWDRLFAKLRAIFPGEPLVALLERWVCQPVIYHGHRIERRRGLPQGLPISPLLANLFLDEFDEEMLGHDYRLVRYADDFVVLARDLDAARAAKRDAERALAQLGLELHPDKTSVHSLGEGLEYLGYGFAAKTVEPHSTSAEAAGMQPNRDWLPPAGSWLVHAPLKRLREISKRGAKEPGAPPEPVRLREGGAGEAEIPDRRPLTIADASARLRLGGKTLVVEGRESEPATVIPIRSLAQVLMIGPPRASLAAVLALGKAGIPVSFADRFGQPYATLDPVAPDWTLWLAQARAAEDPQLRLAFAKSIVAAKLHNAAKLTVRFHFEGGEEAASAICELEGRCDSIAGLDELRGLEGKGAALYFSALRASLPDEWGFAGRKRHPPPDPVNALLSMGYSLLYHRCSSALFAAGLNPRIGLFHVPHGDFAALAADLQEEFRCLIDARVWAFVSRKEIRREDFLPGESSVFLAPEARKRVVREFEQRLVDRFRPEGAEDEMSYGEFLQRQAKRLAEYIAARRGEYLPMRLHA